MNTKICRLAVLLSGSGTTMVNLEEHIRKGALSAKIALVVSSRKRALGIARAEAFGISTRVLTRGPFKRDGVFDPVAYSRALKEILDGVSPDLVVMAGFMTRLDAPVLDHYDVVNVHPALLPIFGGDGYYGHHVHEAVLEAGVKISGATVHFADAAYDHGPIIMQEAVPVLEDDTPDTLAERVQACERRIYPKAVSLYAAGRLKRERRRVRVLDEPQ
jgi:phosphoribosylglycinamide formyltransferase-1